jgi:hypothetical protein
MLDADECSFIAVSKRKKCYFGDFCGKWGVIGPGLAARWGRAPRRCQALAGETPALRGAGLERLGRSMVASCAADGFVHARRLSWFGGLSGGGKALFRTFLAEMR